MAVTPGKRKGKVFEDQLKIIAWSALTLGARLWIYVRRFCLYVILFEIIIL